jgi:hypothetical protein
LTNVFADALKARVRYVEHRQKWPLVSITNLPHRRSTCGTRASELAHLHQLNRSSVEVFERSRGGHDGPQGSCQATHRDVQNWRALHQGHLPEQQCSKPQHQPSCPHSNCWGQDGDDGVPGNPDWPSKAGQVLHQSLGLNMEGQPYRRGQGVGNELIKHGLNCLSHAGK